MKQTSSTQVPLPRVLTIALSLAFTALSLVTFSAAPAAAAEPEPILFGAHPSRRGDQTRVEAAIDLQDTLGGDLGIIRRYFRWEESVVGDPLVDWTIAEGSMPHISLVPRRPNGTPIRWNDIATAAPGSDLDTELRTWARDIADLGVPVWFTFTHEPETTHNLAMGTDAEFIAAWRHVVDVFEEEGADNVEHLWVMTAFAFSRTPDDRRYAQKWYPGDDWVDHIGADPYNWTDCRLDVTTPWKSFETLMTPVRDFAALHPDKGLVAAEFGSAEDPNDSGRKAEWVNEIRRLTRQPEWSQMVAFVAFNARHPDEETPCEWWVDSSPETLDAYQGLLNDPVFGGDGPPPPPPPEDNGLTCKATVVNDTVELTWDPTDGRDIIRRDDSYLASSPTNATSYTDTDPPQAVVTYSIRNWINDDYTDIDCGTLDLTVDIPGNPCSVTTNGSEVTVTWDDTAAREILRRNDAWLRSPTADSTSYTHTSDPGTHNYQLRTWLAGGQFTDTNCGTIIVGGNDQPTCSITLAGNDVTVTWSGFDDGREILRRNDAWRNTPAEGVSSFADTNLTPGNYSYEIRLWDRNGSSDTSCGSVTVG